MQSNIKKKKNPFIRFVRNLLLAFIILAIVAFGIGAAYVWYIGRNDDNRFDSMQLGEEVKAPTIQAAKVDENARVGVALQTISSPITPGSQASISARTNREAVCTLSVKYNDVEVKNVAFIEKTANEFGGVDWDWQVDSNAPIGKWPVTISCKKNKQWGVYTADLEIVKSL